MQSWKSWFRQFSASESRNARKTRNSRFKRFFLLLLVLGNPASTSENLFSACSALSVPSAILTFSVCSAIPTTACLHESSAYMQAQIQVQIICWRGFQPRWDILSLNKSGLETPPTMLMWQLELLLTSCQCSLYNINICCIFISVETK